MPHTIHGHEYLLIQDQRIMKSSQSPKPGVPVPKARSFISSPSPKVGVPVPRAQLFISSPSPKAGSPVSKAQGKAQAKTQAIISAIRSRVTETRLRVCVETALKFPRNTESQSSVLLWCEPPVASKKRISLERWYLYILIMQSPKTSLSLPRMH